MILRGNDENSQTTVTSTKVYRTALGFLAFGFCLQFDRVGQLATLTALVRAQVGHTGSAHSWVGTRTHIFNKQW